MKHATGRTNLRVKAALLTLAISGCASSSALRSMTPPPGGLPTTWQAPANLLAPPPEAHATTGTATAAGAAGPGEAVWWRVFQDPVLDRLMALAQEQNLDLRIAEARIVEARALHRVAGRSLLPELTGSAEITTGRARAAQPVSSSNARAALGASWEVDLFGRLRHETRAADAEQQASLADRDAVRLTLLAEVARSYFEYRLFRSQHDLALKTADAQAATVRITRARFEQGVASRLDVERTVAALAVTRARVPQAAELADAARYRLVLLIASSPGALASFLPVTATLPRSDVGAVLRTPTEVIAGRPDVRAAERRLVAAAARRDAAAALRYPRITLAGLVGVESGNLNHIIDAGTGIWSVGANLLAPLFNFGRIRAAIDAADARQQQAYLSYELTVRTALQEAQTAVVFYAQGAIRQRELAQAVESGRKATELARRQYAEGTLSLLEVLDAERTAYDAELSWSQATAEVSLRLVTLYQTMGVVPNGHPRAGAQAAPIAAATPRM